MAATRRLQKELGEIRSSANKSFRDVQVDESNLLIWQGLLVPEKSPYNKVGDSGAVNVFRLIYKGKLKRTFLSNFPKSCNRTDFCG